MMAKMKAWQCSIMIGVVVIGVVGVGVMPYAQRVVQARGLSERDFAEEYRQLRGDVEPGTAGVSYKEIRALGVNESGVWTSGIHLLEEQEREGFREANPDHSDLADALYVNLFLLYDEKKIEQYRRETELANQEKITQPMYDMMRRFALDVLAAYAEDERLQELVDLAAEYPASKPDIVSSRVLDHTLPYLAAYRELALYEAALMREAFREGDFDGGVKRLRRALGLCRSIAWDPTMVSLKASLIVEQTVFAWLLEELDRHSANLFFLSGLKSEFEHHCSAIDTIEKLRHAVEVDMLIAEQQVHEYFRDGDRVIRWRGQRDLPMIGEALPDDYIALIARLREESLGEIRRLEGLDKLPERAWFESSALIRQIASERYGALHGYLGGISSSTYQDIKAVVSYRNNIEDWFERNERVTWDVEPKE
ncbi:MAG: hypothetical protein AAGB34_06305 [Planctomycetota bacterium]